MALDLKTMSDAEFLSMQHHDDFALPKETSEEPDFLNDEEDVAYEHEEGSDLDGDQDDSEESSQEKLTGEDWDDLDDYGKDLNYLIQPIKANGQVLDIRNREEARQLMELGAKYQAEQAGIDSNLRMLKTLEVNGIDSSNINFLIDLQKKNPKAIAKLIKDAEFNSYDHEDSDYTPTEYTISEKAFNLDKTLNALKGTETYDRTINIISNQWDSASREALTDSPALIAQLNQQMQEGVYEKVSQEVARIKVFGGLQGLSDFDAYRTVGAQMYQDGRLQQNVEPQVQVSRILPKRDEARTTKRKAAAAPRSTKQSQPKQETEDFFNMSDEEFLKQYKIRH